MGCHYDDLEASRAPAGRALPVPMPARCGAKHAGGRTVPLRHDKAPAQGETDGGTIPFPAGLRARTGAG